MIQETDIYGESTLKSMSGADKFNRWMYVQMKPFMQGKILEIGSCIGNILSLLIKDRENVVFSDIRKNYVKKLQQQYSGVEVIQIDLVDPQFDKKHKKLLGTFDFIGKFGWFIVGIIFGKKIIPESNMKIYNPLGPIFKVIDKILLNQMGLNVIQV
jgi:hypothetical protein|tara:strand:+ start:275 stop:742 length:468 start_codon:yes stop_codon:yes gene_type:complete